MIEDQGFSVVGGSFQQVENTFTHGVVRVKVSREKSVTVASLRALKDMDDSIYVRACLPIASEPQVIAGISALVCQDPVLPIVGIDISRHIIIQIGGLSGFDVEPNRIMNRLAAMHISSISAVAALKERGVPDRNISWMSASFDVICQHRSFRSMSSSNKLYFRGLAQCVRSLCLELSGYRIPHTLVHGKLGVEDVYGSFGIDPKVFFKNWAFCGISHPLFDYLHITEMGFQAIDDEEAKNHYSQFWNGFVSKKTFTKAVGVARPLMHLYKLYAFLHIHDELEEDEQRDIAIEMTSLVRAVSGTIGAALGLSSAKTDRTVYDLIVPSPDGSCVLAYSSGGQKCLPKISLTLGIHFGRDSWEDNLEGLTSSLASECGLSAFFLRPARRRTGPCDVMGESVLITDSVDTWTVRDKNAMWLDLNQALRCVWNETWEGLKPVQLLKAYASERTLRVVGFPPWRRVAFLKTVIAWVKPASLARQMKLDGVFHQVRNTHRSSVLVGTVRPVGGPDPQTERIYVKTVPVDSIEPRMSHCISSILADVTPDVLDVNLGLNTFIQRDGGEHVPPVMDVRLLAETIATFQKRSLDDIDALVASGARFRGADIVKEQLQNSFQNSLLDSLNNDATVAELRMRVPEIMLYCDELSRTDIPYTLVHGDLHLANIGYLDEKRCYQIFDWRTAFLGHPFCDFAVFCATANLSEAERLTAEEVYFLSWEKYGNHGELGRINRLALIVYWAMNTCSILHGEGNREESCKQAVLAKQNTSITFLKGSMDEHRAYDSSASSSPDTKLC